MKKFLLLFLILSGLQINAQCWKTVATGAEHTVAIKADGTLWAWGFNGQGQLGDGSWTNRNAPKKIGTAQDWKTLAIGFNHTIAQKEDGTIWAWGDNYYGQLGDGTNSGTSIPAQIGTTNDWQMIAAGSHHTVAIKTDGTLWTWGGNDFGELGDGTTIDKNIPAQIGTANDWQTVTAGYSCTIALKKDGTLWAWGYNSSWQLGDGTTTHSSLPKQIGTATDWKAISVGTGHTAALKTDGTLWAWGRNPNGALGDGTTTNKTVPTQIGTATDWKTINVGTEHSIATKTNGSLWTWGRNFYGQLGNGTNTESLVPVQIGTANSWQKAVAGSHYTVALDTDNTISTWGNNSNGQLGDGTAIDKKVPTIIACPGTLLVNISQVNVSCNGNSNGSAAVTSVSGGTAPYSYLWSNGATTASITRLAAGNYSCTITDNTLSIIKTITITEPTPLVSTAIITNTSCKDNNDGSLIITATGGTPNYQYALYPELNYQNLNFFSGLSTGNYLINVKDYKGCIFSNNLVITANSTPLPTAMTQTFNTGATVGNLLVDGSDIKWYNAITEGIVLDVSTALQTGTYYVSQTINGCESARTAVDVIINPVSTNEPIPTSGLLAYYPFTGNANDTSGNGNNGIASNVTLTTDRYGMGNSAYSFNGTSSYIEADILNYPLKGESRTITGWFKADVPTASKEFDFGLLNYGNTTDPDHWFKISFYLKGYLDIQFDDKTFQSQDNYFNNEWTFFAMTFDDATNTYSLYINNVYKMGGTADLYTNGFDTLFSIGRNKSNNYFEGAIDDIGIWNRVLTQEEISSLYNPSNNDLSTLIPDPIFEQKLINLGIESGTVDGKILTSKINTVKHLNVTNSSITDLTGIQDFTALTNLYCDQNQLTALNVSKNSFLTTLYCNNNKIESLDVSQNIALDTLSCYTNRIAVLDVKINKALKKLDCGSNPISTLDVSANTALTFLGCNTSLLTTLDISNNTALTLFDCRDNQLKNLNVLTNTALDYLDCSNNQLTALDVSSNTSLSVFYCTGNLLTTLDVSANPALSRLVCFSNQLTSLDLSNNPALNYLNCKLNKLKALDLTKNIALKNLYCYENQITTLDLRKNTALTTLNCSANLLTTLNLKNGNNIHLDQSNINSYINFKNNPNLSCIQVDDKEYADANWAAQKDVAASYNTDCASYFTQIPDPNFEQKLIDLGIDTDGLNGKITSSDINTITSLDLSYSNIKDLTGIENFAALTILDCSNNQLIFLDLSKNTHLQILYVTGNPLVYINLKNGNNQNLIVESQTGKKTVSTAGTSFLGLTALGCVKVDNAAFSDANWSKIKETTTIYSETCTLGLEDSQFNKAVVYPNPTKGEVNILNIAIEKATVYNALGQLVKTVTLDAGNTHNMINLSGLPKGIYYVYLIHQDAATVKKIIVE